MRSPRSNGSRLPGNVPHVIIRRPLLLAVASVVLLGAGAGVAFVLTDELGIRTEDVEIPVERVLPAPDYERVVPPQFTSFDAPDSVRIDDRPR